MSKIDPQQMNLSRRERQIMDVIYRRGQATALDVIGEIPEPPSYSTIRALLVVLEKKGHLKHTKEGAKYLYAPVRSRQQAAKSALKRVLKTFFESSVEKAVAALLDNSDKKLSDQDLDRMAKLIEKAKKENR
jgi:predicted transcriptional regulator